jgi:hypothetical protein
MHEQRQKKKKSLEGSGCGGRTQLITYRKMPLIDPRWQPDIGEGLKRSGEGPKGQ